MSYSLKTPTKPASQASEICDGRINYAKLKEYGAENTQIAPKKNKAPLSMQCEETAHPRQSDDGTRTPVTWVGKEGAAMTDKDDRAPLDKALGLALEAKATKTLQVDVERYQAWLDDPALSPEQREQIITALWQIILCFVDLGFGVSPLESACGQVAQSEGFCGAQAQDMVVSEAEPLTNEFNTNAAEYSSQEKEES